MHHQSGEIDIDGHISRCGAGGLGTVYRAIATQLTRKAGYTKTTAQTGAVTLIQCFGGALNLNIHYHMLFLRWCLQWQ